MYFLYILLCVFWVSVNSSIFDQRQTGDVNVQVDVKDLQIFAAMKGDKEEYVDYDYAYDYSELTIKPQNRTTPKPSPNLSTSQTNTISDTTLLQENTTTTEDFLNATISPFDNDLKTTIKYSSENTSHDNSQKNVTVKPTSNTTIKNCRRGFVLNQRGDCQLKINSTGNA
ncbi:unnamed protein product [Euphydryas editha]|uniref:Uncharacterized protein n=1 Tax=Euphydryas editha TaxID=104508 RepID=A0AAU9TKF4_EUPED|nr:unnamed protein product [Euphydryas editha]